MWWNLAGLAAFAAMVVYSVRMSILGNTERMHTACDLLRLYGPQTGLELVKLSKGKLRRGTIYVLLSRLEECGKVTSWPIDHQTPSRRVYKLVART